MKGQYTITASVPGFKVTPQQVDINRFLPRAHLVLQLEPEGETFRTNRGAAVVDANVPEKARSEFQKGSAALTDKKLEDAILHLENAISVYHNYYEAHRLLGSVYMDQQKWEKASSILRRALEIKPNAVDSMISLAEVYRRQKKYDDGEKLVQEALKLDEKSWLAHYTLGRIYWEKSDLVNAGKQTGLAIQLEPGFPDSRLLAGNIFVKAGLPENAVIEYEEYLRLEPNGQFAGQIRELLPKLKSLTVRKKS
jgi:tetratricopeptide (TPR) repeat protein